MNFLLLLSIFLFVSVQVECLFLCQPDYCSTVKCTKTVCEGENKILAKGICGCCDECHTVLNEGEPCEEPFLLGGSPPTVYCDTKQRLICLNQTCTNIANIH